MLKEAMAGGYVEPVLSGALPWWRHVKAAAWPSLVPLWASGPHGNHEQLPLKGARLAAPGFTAQTQPNIAGAGHFRLWPFHARMFQRILYCMALRLQLPCVWGKMFIAGSDSGTGDNKWWVFVPPPSEPQKLHFRRRFQWESVTLPSSLQSLL